MIYVILFFAHIYMTFKLLDACEQKGEKEFIKKYKIVLWIPIINYIFALTLETRAWLKSYIKNFKTL